MGEGLNRLFKMAHVLKNVALDDAIQNQKRKNYGVNGLAATAVSVFPKNRIISGVKKKISTSLWSPVQSSFSPVNLTPPQKTPSKLTSMTDSSPSKNKNQIQLSPSVSLDSFHFSIEVRN